MAGLILFRGALALLNLDGSRIASDFLFGTFVHLSAVVAGNSNRYRPLIDTYITVRNTKLNLKVIVVVAEQLLAEVHIGITLISTRCSLVGIRARIHYIILRIKRLIRFRFLRVRLQNCDIRSIAAYRMFLAIIVTLIIVAYNVYQNLAGLDRQLAISAFNDDKCYIKVGVCVRELIVRETHPVCGRIGAGSYRFAGEFDILLAVQRSGRRL